MWHFPVSSLAATHGDVREASNESPSVRVAGLDLQGDSMSTKVASIPKFPKAGWAGHKLRGWTAKAVAKVVKKRDKAKAA